MKWKFVTWCSDYFLKNFSSTRYIQTKEITKLVLKFDDRCLHMYSTA